MNTQSLDLPEDLGYTARHVWARKDGDTLVIGITDFAQSELGDLVFINLPAVGDGVTLGTAMCDVESVKAVSDIMSPVTGTVAEVNEELLDAPQKLNESPYGAWIARIENVTETEELLGTAKAILHASERRQARLFVRRDVYGRFYSVLVYLPKDRYTTTTRLRIEAMLREVTGSTTIDYATTMGEGLMARLH